MNKATNSEFPPAGTVFPSGTIVLQYVDDGENFVGVVVDDRMHSSLNNDQKDHWDRGRPGDLQICLVLKRTRTWPGNVLENTAFPYYAVGRRDSATPIMLEEELHLHRLQHSAASRGLLSYVRLREEHFGFDPEQTACLELVYAVRAFQNNAPLREKAEWMEFVTDEDLALLNDTLENAIEKKSRL